MNNLSLTACSFFFKQKNSKKKDDFLCLNTPLKANKEFGQEEFEDVMQALVRFYDSLGKTYDDHEKQKLFSCDPACKQINSKNGYTYLFGKVNSGAYGIEADIVDTKTKKTLYKQKADQANVKPFYIFFAIPHDANGKRIRKGLLFFQNVGQYGIKTITTDYLSTFFGDRFNLKYIWKNISPEQYLEEVFKHSRTNKIIFSRNVLSEDVADGIQISKGRIETAYINPVMNEKLKQKIFRVLKGTGINKYSEFSEMNYDKVKINVQNGDNTRTIDIMNIENMSLIEAIPNEVRDTLTGHAKEKELLDHFCNKVDEYIDNIIWDKCI